MNENEFNKELADRMFGDWELERLEEFGSLLKSHPNIFCEPEEEMI